MNSTTTPHDSPDIGLTPARDLFHRRGLRCTRQREILYDALRATTAHPTADELLDGLGGKSAELSLATVYNTLDALEGAGLVRRLPSRRGNAPARYDADVSSHVHVSTADGRVLDLPHEISERIMAAVPAELLEEVERLTGVRVGGLHVEVLGISPEA
ncbi:MAG: Fe2+ or Zn2+ uptake regulation protein [Phycisphaerales bacterium]|jgi:Fe2+ or Zn2+ uptake regulation protein